MKVKDLLKQARLVEAVSDDHERLVSDLRSWAKGRGFKSLHLSLPDGSRPDVLRSNDGANQLFIGDAKVSANETCLTKETTKRIANYFDEFAKLLDMGDCDGGILAIATDNRQAALDWVSVLNGLARKAEITGPKNSPPNFRVLRLVGKQTWIAYW